MSLTRGSDLLYDIRDMNQEVLRSVEKTHRDLEAHDKSSHKPKEPEVQAHPSGNSQGRVDNSAQPANDTLSQGLRDMESMSKEIEHIRSLLTESRISSSPNPVPSSAPSTPALSRDISDFSVLSSSQETTASSVSSSQSNPQPGSHSAREVDILAEHPLLHFKENRVRLIEHTFNLSNAPPQFQFVVALLFIQRTSKSKHQLACQRASECLATYPTPEALSKAFPEDLVQYFIGIGLHNTKPDQLIKLAQGYVADPPQRGRLRSKSGVPQSEISHLPQIGKVSVEPWLVYWCGRTDVVTQDKTLLAYMALMRT